jgi:hypothetical protein
MGICLPGAQRQRCAEDQIGDNGFPQGAGRLVASRDADVAGDHDAAGQRHPEPEHPWVTLFKKIRRLPRGAPATRERKDFRQDEAAGLTIIVCVCSALSYTVT